MSDEPAPPARARIPWIWLLPFCITVGCAWLLIVWLKTNYFSDSGVELGYRVTTRAGDPAILDAARRRVQSVNPRFDVRVDSGVLVLRLSGASPGEVIQGKRLFQIQGDLQLCTVAPIPVQQKFNQDKVVPEGWVAVGNDDRRRGIYESYGAQILVRQEAIIDGRHIVTADPKREMAPGGHRWVTTFELNAEGARRFDEAAEILYRQRPPGLIAIIIDGVLKSAPSVQAPSFEGHGQISGAKGAEEAKDLAIILRSGALPVPLESPEFERPYGPKKK